MKKSILAITFLLLLQTAFSQFSSDRYHPKEIIKNLKIDTCKIYYELKDTLILKEAIVYDSLGNETEVIRYYQDCSWKYYYDDAGKKVASYFIPFGEGFYERDTLIYNEKGNLIKSVTYSNQGNESLRHEYEYAKGKLVKESYYLSGNLHVLSEYSYDKKGRLSKVKRTFRGNPDGIWIYTYDKDNNMTGFKSISASGETDVNQFYKYDQDNRKTEMAAYGRAGTLDQVYKTNYLPSGLIESEEAYSEIQNGDLKQADYSKTVYRYTYR